MYFRRSGKRPLLTCGRYTRANGAECHNNSVDAEATLRVVLNTIAQIIHRHGGRDTLVELLMGRARKAAQASTPHEGVLKALGAKVSELECNLATVQRRLASERDDEIYAALREEYEQTNTELRTARQRLEQEKRARRQGQAADPEENMAAAIALLDDIERITADPNARAEINGLLVRLGMWVGLSFLEGIKGKKRKVRRLASGVITFGDPPLPVPLYGADNADGPDTEGGGADP
jgi:DNA repair exonuclease SbcCD ATPase subunit